MQQVQLGSTYIGIHHVAYLSRSLQIWLLSNRYTRTRVRMSRSNRDNFMWTNDHDMIITCSTHVYSRACAPAAMAAAATATAVSVQHHDDDDDDDEGGDGYSSYTAIRQSLPADANKPQSALPYDDDAKSMQCTLSV